MALLSRLSRLFQADFHAVLDRIEEPDLQLRQALREMQFALDQDRQRQQLLRHEVTQLTKSMAAVTDNLQALDDELDICLAAEKDELARDLVRRKLAAEKRLQSGRERLAGLEQQCRELELQIDEQSGQLADMKQKLELLVSADEYLAADEFTQADAIRNEEIEIALLREKQRRAQS